MTSNFVMPMKVGQAAFLDGDDDFVTGPLAYVEDELDRRVTRACERGEGYLIKNATSNMMPKMSELLRRFPPQIQMTNSIVNNTFKGEIAIPVLTDHEARMLSDVQRSNDHPEGYRSYVLGGVTGWERINNQKRMANLIDKWCALPTVHGYEITDLGRAALIQHQGD